MALTFSVSSDFLGEQREDALGSHDPSTRVTVANREEYVQLYINYILEVSVREQYSAFEEGFYRCVDKATISLFRPEELQLLLLGKEEELDVSLLQKAATYQDGYTEDSPAVSMFWSVCRGFSPEEKKKLLMFITGSDRIPLGGPQSLRLTIGRSGPDTDR
ncbi:ubiquitin-protein ligase E3A [Cyclospora cayetanensis]|uniref:HECT-type E3 ubiquitin transferase n=1 Tax=Cyclospora cayetanensis TaxID=88456 RepID=A0A6P6S2H4_9EIME|nr:ubiquitin-protein ligase E3A [Cyclospora cayetanensis]